MKKLFALLTVFGMLTFGVTNLMAQGDDAAGDNMAQDTTMVDDSTQAAMTAVDTNAVTETAPADVTNKEDVDTEKSLHKMIKKYFIQGGAGFMGVVLLCLIFGLALAIERIIYLNLATTNTTKLLKNVENALDEGGIDGAKEVCRNTRGPIASIFYQGLDRHSEGIEAVEKSVVSYGSVQMGLLERGLPWIALFIALAPMLGFMGTVIGMIQAFDAIEVAGDISPSLVAAGIKVALLTTVFGLIVAIILQIFYNYIVSKIDSIVNNMEDASISLIDLITKYNIKNK